MIIFETESINQQNNKRQLLIRRALNAIKNLYHNATPSYPDTQNLMTF